MTQEEKAKAYDEAIERAKVMHEEGMMTERLEYLFPELKESEDEKMRKELIDAIQGLWDNDALPMPLSLKRKDAWIAWLSSQGEKTNPYSGISFEYNGHIWGMCARDNGVDISLDKQLFKHLENQGESTLIEEIKRRKELLLSEKEKEVSIRKKLSLGGRIALLEELLVFAKEKQGEQEQKPAGCNHLAELAEGEVTTSNGISEDMLGLRIEHTPLSTRAKNLLRYQFDTIGDMVSWCDGKWRRLRALRNLGKVTYNEIMEYLGVDDRL